MSFAKKRILIIFTGGTVAGNVAKSEISENKKSAPDDFLTTLKDSIEIVKKIGISESKRKLSKF